MTPEEQKILNEIHRALSGNNFAGVPGLIKDVKALTEKVEAMEEKLEQRENKNKYLIQGISAGLGVAGAVSLKAIWEVISKIFHL